MVSFIENPYIESLVPNPLSVMYARNTSIATKIVLNSNGIVNMLENYTIEHISASGDFVSATPFTVEDTSQQIFDFPLGPASTATAGTYNTSKYTTFTTCMLALAIFMLSCTWPQCTS